MQFLQTKSKLDTLALFNRMKGGKGLKDNNKSRLKQEQDHHPPKMITKQEHIGR
jgi:hypothetical protein